ncbi:hydroxymethylbilane synthase [Enemella evansiae]|uniref:hydroxymethylbilane synthase n=1 Tax=Enemella evansiae TaxID=2016499 RepID=UPI000B979E8E|nr:hydroxymethylbilane synthase [Enemella evansiae]OYO16903.1 hydroxymethylbilane synthase [Enemella evansiae]
MSAPAQPGRDTGPIRIGARRSPLAVAQAEWVADRLRALGAEVELVGIDTRGDVDRRHLTEIGGTGVFAVAVREAVLAGEVDVAVHSMKDLPTAPAPGLEIAAIPEREDPRDVLVGQRLATLTDGMVIGTGSPRRAAQLQAYARERGLQLEFRPIRGNVGTRLALVEHGEVDATVLAAAGLRRLGLLDALPSHEILDPDVLAPAAAQGALAIEIARAARPGVPELIARLDDPATRAAVTAEREFLRTLEAGCLAPVGVLARTANETGGSTDLTLAAVIGRTFLSTSAQAGSDDAPPVRIAGSAAVEQGAELGRELAGQALARLG